jgi:hypothetical protein
MAISRELGFAKLDELYLDPNNPRLGRNNTGSDVKQERILALMQDWKLDELAVSFLDSGGFWTQEALLVIKESLYGKPRLVVLEGNRRLAALFYLRDALAGKPANRKWEEIAKGAKPAAKLFEKIPYLLAAEREDVEAFTGFRHVTGIEEWRPAEKAEYIAKLVDKGLDYRKVKRMIGSKTQTVRQNYISYRLLLQAEETKEIPEENFEDRFSVMYLSLRTDGVQKYLQIDIQADPDKVRREIPKIHRKALTNFALWLFGDEKRLPLFTDSRQVDNFGRILEKPDAVEYLERSESPSFDVALRMAGGDEPEIVKLVNKAADNIELALTRAHHFRKSKKLEAAVERLGTDARRLLELFPSLRDQICKEE